MTIRSAWMQGGSYPAQADRDVLTALFDEGVIRGCSLTPGTPARTVTIGLGQAIVGGDNTGNLNQTYVATVSVAEVVAIGAAPGSGTRVDLVGFLVQDPTAGGAAGNNIVASVVAGTVGAGLPATPNSFLPICSVTISAGQTAVTAGMVTDLRTWAEPKQAVGSVKFWYGSAARVPKGWAILTTSGTPNALGAYTNFPDLAEMLGITSGTITLPDMRGRSPIAIDPSTAGYDTLGELAGTTVETAPLPTHAHTMDHDHGTQPVTNPSTALAFAYPLGLSGVSPSQSIYAYTGSISPTTGTPYYVDLANYTGNTGAFGPGGTHNNVGPVVAMHLLIRVL